MFDRQEEEMLGGLAYAAGCDWNDMNE